jgi:hypothetical protein
MMYAWFSLSLCGLILSPVTAFAVKSLIAKLVNNEVGIVCGAIAGTLQSFCSLFNLYKYFWMLVGAGV